MTSAYSINLNFNNTILVKTDFTFKQGDKGITLNLATTGLDTTGTTAHIVFKRSNGTSVEAALTGQTGPSYSYTILGNEFEIPGVVVADLKLYNGDTQRISTASFIFLVTGDTMDGVGGGTGGYSDQLKQLSQEFADTLEQYEEAFADVGAVHAAGNYNPTTEYSPLDLVYYSADNSTYLCVEGCTGETPSPSSQYWQLVVDGSSVATPDFDDLGDVDMTGVQNGQVPTYNSTTHKYEPGNGGGGSAADITYDNTTSKLSATKVQGAIDETNGRITYLYNMTGGKNILPNTGTTEVKNAVTFTKNDSDGTFTLNSSGASGDTYKNIFNSSDIALRAGNNYIMTGFETPTANYKIQLNFYIAGEWVSWYADEGEVFTMPSGVTQVSINIFVKSGASFSNLKCYPMIRDASISDDTYIPYAMTNRELTENVTHQNDFFNNQTVYLNTPTETGGARVVWYANNITFKKGFNVVRIINPNTNALVGVFMVASVDNNAYYRGIYFGYYVDNIYSIVQAGSTPTAKQLVEQS